MIDKREHAGVISVYSNGRRQYDPAWKSVVVASCLEPGASIARLALEHGVNANLVWKWIQKHNLSCKEALVPAPLSAAAFIPVHIENAADEFVLEAARTGLPDLVSNNSGVLARDAEMTCPALPSAVQLPAKLPTKLNVSLPNEVQLTLDCDDLRALTAVLGVVCDVQTGR